MSHGCWRTNPNDLLIQCELHSQLPPIPTEANAYCPLTAAQFDDAIQHAFGDKTSELIGFVMDYEFVGPVLVSTHHARCTDSDMPS